MPSAQGEVAFRSSKELVTSRLGAATAVPLSVPRHIGFVDALRGLAFLAVFVFHVGCMVPGLPTLLGDIVGRGYAGVQLFFVLSAFTLSASLAARGADRAALKAYCLRRIFRVVPMFWVAIALYLWVIGFEPHWGTPDGLEMRHVVLAALLLHGFDAHALNGVVPGGWSVAVEIQFYLMLPAMFLYADTLRRATLLTAAALLLSIVAMPMIEAALAPYFPVSEREIVHQYAFYSLPAQLPIFCFGLLAYRLLGPDRAALARVETFLPARAEHRAGLALAMAICLALPPCLTRWPLGLVHGAPGHLGFGVAAALLLYALSTASLRVIDNAAMRFLGKISYSGYLLHFAVLYYVGLYLPLPSLASPVARLLVLSGVGLSITAALAFVTFTFVERTGLDLGRKLTRPRAAPAMQTLDGTLVGAGG